MPVRYPRVLIVDAPSTTRNVIYDFNDDTQSLAGGSKTELSAAQWEFGSIDLLGDPDAIGVEYSLQRITFQQTVTGGKPAAMSRLVQHSRALSQRRFWLEFQLTATTAPVWWHAYRSAPSDLSIELVYVREDGPKDRWVLNGGIDVDAFSYAARVALPTQTVGNNPANDATVPSSGYNLPTAKGDAPSRLRVSVTPSASNASPQRWLVACIASNRSTPVLRVDIGTGDGFSASNGTAGPSSSVGAAGGSRRLVTYSDMSDLPRLTGDLPGSGQSAPPGRYLVVLRVASRSNAGAHTLTMHLNNSFTGMPFALPVVASWSESKSQTENYQNVPLGVVSIGDGLPVDVTLPTRVTTDLYIRSSQTDAETTLDHYLLVPIDGPDLRTSMVQVTGTGPTPTLPLMLDGNTENTWLSGSVQGAYTYATNGEYPTVDPAAAFNTLLVLPMLTPIDVGSSGTPRVTALGATAQVAVSYHPRSASLGDGT